MSHASVAVSGIRHPPPRRETGVRPLAPEDLDRLVELHGEAFGHRSRQKERRAFLSEIFFGHPWDGRRFPSLGYVEPGGRLVGCLGAMPRPMMLGSEPIHVVVTHNFMVDPAHRNGLVAIRLLREMVDRGPGWLLAEGNETSRRISHALGGAIVNARSNRWLRILRPAGLAVSLLERRSHPPLPPRLCTALARAPDAFLTTLPGARLPRADGDGDDRDLRAGSLADLVQRHAAEKMLWPLYTEESLGWILETLRHSRRDQTLRARAVHVRGEAEGWYVYYSRRGGVGRVLQLGASARGRRRVLARLLTDAKREGNVALSGLDDPAWHEELRAAGCLFRPGTSWLLSHTSNPDLHRLLEGPDAFLSRLEGEGWLRFAS